MELSEIKNWNLDLEKEMAENWKKAEMFKFNPQTNKKIYSIDTPPPYINSPIHMGHAVTYCFMDFFARFKRMKGYEVLFPLGLDRNGLPIEMAAEKKFKISPFSVTREEFVEACEKLLKEASAESVDSFAKLGISFSSYKEGEDIGSIYKTDSPEYRKLTQLTFVDLYKKGLIYEDNRINNWDPKLRTTIADSEIEYKEIASTFNNIKWKVKESGEEIVIGTTRPELICTCGMVIFNPEDERFKHLEGMTAISPIFGKEIPIKSHPVAQMDKGTGIAMMCSAGDLTDIQFFREQGLVPQIAIEMDGKMNDIAGPLSGLKVRLAREKMIELLKDAGLLVKQDNVIHRTPISERSKAEVEFIQMPEFYLKQMEMKDDLRNVINNVSFYPESSKKILDSWVDSVSIDWPISRRRYYATPIPLWCSEGLVCVPNELVYVEPWREQPKETFEVLKDGNVVGTVADFPDVKWEGEVRVLDTWFDSSISELNLLRYKQDEAFFEKAYPCSLRPQGKEIVRTWLYYTLLRGYLETGKACFEDVWIHQHVLDSRGKKMSKSLGNVIDPQDILKQEGAEALRMWASIEGDLSKGDFICSRDKIKAEKKTLNKILNVSKFVAMFDKPSGKPELQKVDRLLIDYIEELTAKCETSFDKYDFNHPMQDLRHFLWEIFASHYLELVKTRAYNQDEKFTEEESASARWTLHYVLERFLILIYPVLPQLSSLILESRGIDAHSMSFPEVNKGDSDLALMESIMKFNSEVWKAKKEAGISLRDSIEDIEIPEKLKVFEKDILATHKLE